MELTPTLILNLALLIVPPVALVLAFWQRLAQHIRWTVALTALCVWEYAFARSASVRMASVPALALVSHEADPAL